MGIFIQEQFTGGISEGSKRGLQGAFQDGYGIDYRTDPDEVTALKKLSKDSGTSVTDLIKKFVENSNGDTWGYGDSGKVYKRTSGGTWSNPKTVSDSHGNGMEIFNDELWYAGDAMLGKATDITGSAVFNDDYLVTPQYEAPDEANVTASNTYTLQTSVNEGATHKFSFTPTVDTFTGITVNITAKGTGNWTFVFHDASNNALAELTVANADLPASGVSRVVFAGLGITSGNTYHVHIYSTAADGTVRVETASDLSTAEISILQSLPDFDVDQSNPVSTASFVALSNTYTVPTAISENATAKQTFSPLVSSLDGISFLFDAIGAGNLTVTIHNPLDESVGSATITNANLKAKGNWVKVEFSTPLELQPGIEYHMHVTSDTASAVKIYTSTAADFETSYFKTYFSILNNDEEYHIMKVFGNLLCIGNGNVLSTIDDAEVFEREAIVFPEGERVRCLETIGDYLAIATWKGSLAESYSRIYFWDGASPTFNAFVTIDGVTNSMRNDGNNMMYILHGTQGILSVYDGAITKLRKIKNADQSIKTYFYPEAMETLEGLLYFGNYGTTNTAIDTMVYSYGRSSKEYPYSMNKDYIISEGDKDTGVSIGSVIGLSGDKFMVSWKNDSTYGVDILDTTTDQAIAVIETLRFDGGDPAREKHFIDFSIRCRSITATQSITVERQRNNLGTWEEIGTLDGSVADDLGKHYRCFNIDEWAFEMEFRITLETSGTDAPTLLQYALNFESNDQFHIDDKDD